MKAIILCLCALVLSGPLSAKHCSGGRCHRSKPTGHYIHGVSDRGSMDLTSQIPEINVKKTLAKGYIKVPDVAQYGHADWRCAVGIARGISRAQAFAIANNLPEVTYFFHMKGTQMMLGVAEGEEFRLFYKGDAVFFSGEPCWGSAVGLADGYVKKQLVNSSEGPCTLEPTPITSPEP